MKKVLIFLTLTVLLLLCLTACHRHNYVDGMCTDCGACKHERIYTDSKEPTCTETGLTEGKKCLDCKKIIQEQKIIDALGHDEHYAKVIYSHTCNVYKLINCYRCHNLAEEVFIGVEHTPGDVVTENSITATCQSVGSYDSVIYCTKCKADLERVKHTVSKLDHVEDGWVIDKNATCTEDGAKHLSCKNCDEKVKTEVLPATGHSETDWIVDKEATKSEDGKRHTECTSCGSTLKEEILYATGSLGLNYTLKSDGKSYFVANMGTCTDTDIIIPNFYNGLPVTSIGGNAFNGQSSLESVTISNSITSIAGYAFANCDSLVSIIIPNSVMNIGDYAFSNCDLLSNISIPNSVTNIGGNAFSNCISLISIDISNSVKEIGDSTFYGCQQLSNISIPNGVTRIGDEAFSYCKLLASITIPNSVTNIGSSAFRGCSSLANVYYTGEVEEWVRISFDDYRSNPLWVGANLFFNGEIASDITLPDSVTSIGNYAFYACRSLTKITIGDSVVSIGSEAFCDCDLLTNVIIGNGETSIGDSAFCDCDSLKNVILGNGLISIGRSAFYSCDSLVNITIPNSVTSISDYSFSYCNSLKNVTLGNGLISIGGSAFFVCNSLTSFNFEGTIEQWNTIKAFDLLIGSYTIYCTDGEIAKNGTVTYYPSEGLEFTFLGSSYTVSGIGSCTDTELVIPSTYQGLPVTGIDVRAFESCTSLTSVIIPNSVTIISNNAFEFCTSLTNVLIPNSVNTIGSGAFYACSSLTSIVIPESVNVIGTYAFQECSSLTIYCERVKNHNGDYLSFWHGGRPIVWGYKEG